MHRGYCRNKYRAAFSLCNEIKRNLTEPLRNRLCFELSEHVSEALNRWPDDPLIVNHDGMVLALSEHPNPDKAGKVLVRIRAYA